MSDQDQTPGTNNVTNQNPDAQNQPSGTSTGQANGQTGTSDAQPPLLPTNQQQGQDASSLQPNDGNAPQPQPPLQPPPLDDASGNNTLLSDKTFQALHDAFLLGWNLLELRSRILLAALDTKFQEADNQVAAFDLVDSIFATLLPQHDDTSSEMPTTRSGLLSSDPFEKLPVEPSDAVWNTSVWRAMFNRIVALQIKLVKTNNTSGTIYDVSIPGQTPSDEPDSPYSYLYIPKTVTDTFTRIGISASDTVDFAIPPTFKLYDITRRTLNCLTQLYVNPNEVLNPSTLAANRDHIVTTILGATPPIALKSTGANSPDDVRVAIRRCTGLTVRFLEAWDGYVRESFYVGQNYENYEIGMIAYEAGRALCTLSWGIALFVVPLENALAKTTEGSEEHKKLMQQLYSAWQNVFNPRDIIHIQHQLSGLSNALDGAYYRIKNANSQNQLPDQHFDPSNDDDPCLPSNALHCIKRSLDYWQAAIEWIGGAVAQKSIRSAHHISTNEQDDVPIISKGLSGQLRMALIEQADVWQSLLTGQQTLRSITTEEVTQGILSKFMQDCEKAFMSDVTSDVKQEVEEVKKNTEQLLWRNRVLFIALLAVAVILLILFVAVEVIAFLPNSQQGNSWLGNAIVTLASFLGVGFVVHRTTQAQSPSPQTTSTNSNSGQPTPQNSSGSDLATNSSTMLDSIRCFFVSSGTEIGDLFSACSRAIQKQYETLNRNASASYPLIEVFVMNSQPKSPKKKENMKPLPYDFGVNDSYSFLTSVIWTNADREEEIQSIVRATFGPLGELIGSSGSQYGNHGGDNNPPGYTPPYNPSGSNNSIG